MGRFYPYTMPKLKKYVRTQNLQQYRTWIEDGDPQSRYFRISQLPDVLTSGKNSFLINGSDELQPDTEVLVQLSDALGNEIYHQPVARYVDGLSRVVAVEIYEDTPPGLATLTVLGRLRWDKDGQLPPDEFKNAYNVRWQKTILVDPAKPNITQIRLYRKPTLRISELLVAQRNVSTGSVNVVNVGSVAGVTSYMGVRTPYTAIVPTGFVFTRDMVDSDVAFVSNGIPYSGTVDSIVNSTTAYISPIFTSSTSLTNPFTTSEFSLTYSASNAFTSSLLTRSFADVTIDRLTTFTGDVQRIKLYYKGVDEPGDYQFLSDVVVDTTELTSTASFNTGEPLLSMGTFTSQSIVDSYWNSGYITNAAYIIDPNVTLGVDSTELLDAMHITYPSGLYTGSTGIPSVFFGLKSPVVFDSSVEYELHLDAIGKKSDTTFASSLDVYLFGTAFPSSSTNPYGTLIHSFAASSGSTRATYIDQVVNFTSATSGSALLRFVTNGGDWHVANVKLLYANARGFNPDVVRILAPVTSRRFERLIFKAELYDFNNNRVPVELISDDIYFDGGNAVIRGSDNRLEGMLTVAGQNSSIVLSAIGYTSSDGTPVRGSSIYIGAGKHIDANTPFIAADSGGVPVFSLGDKLYTQMSGSEYQLVVSGTIIAIQANIGSPWQDIRTFISASVVSNSAYIDAQDLIYSAAQASYTTTISASMIAFSASAEQSIASASILDSANRVKIPTFVSKTTAGLYIESSSIGFWQPHPSGSGISQSNFPVVINSDGQFRFAASGSWVGPDDTGAFSEQIAFANGALAIQTQNLLVDIPTLQIVAVATASAASNVIKLGPTGSGTSLVAGSGLYVDGDGNFRVGSDVTGSDFIQITPGNGLLISGTNFFLNASASGVGVVRVNNSEVALGNPIPTSFAPSTAERGFYVNRLGHMFIGSGSVTLNTGSYLSFGGSEMSIRLTSFSLATSTMKFDSRGAGTGSWGAATGYQTSQGTGVWIDGSGRIRAGNSTHYVLFDGSSFSLNPTSLAISTGNGLALQATPASAYIALGSATSRTNGTGVWLQGTLASVSTPEFRVGNPAGSRIDFDGSNLIVSASAFKITATNLDLDSVQSKLSLGSATSRTVGTGVWMRGTATPEFRVGDPAGSRIDFDGSALIVSASSFKLSATNFDLNSVNSSLGLGSATSRTVGTGVWLRGTGTPEFRVGDPSGKRLDYNGTTLILSGTIWSDDLVVTSLKLYPNTIIDLGFSLPFAGTAYLMGNLFPNTNENYVVGTAGNRFFGVAAASGTFASVSSSIYRDGSNTPVVGARKTGWSAATGTPTRTTFDTTTVTTQQLAERVKALIDDLISHGLIGS